MKIFDTYEKVEGLRPCKKRPIVVYAKQMNEEFRVNTLEGNYKIGKAGDYLMCGIDKELYICNKEIFEKTYDWLYPVVQADSKKPPPLKSVDRWKKVWFMNSTNHCVC